MGVNALQKHLRQLVESLGAAGAEPLPGELLGGAQWTAWLDKNFEPGEYTLEVADPVTSERRLQTFSYPTGSEHWHALRFQSGIGGARDPHDTNYRGTVKYAVSRDPLLRDYLSDSGLVDARLFLLPQGMDTNSYNAFIQAVSKASVEITSGSIGSQWVAWHNHQEDHTSDGRIVVVPVVEWRPDWWSDELEAVWSDVLWDHKPTFSQLQGPAPGSVTSLLKLVGASHPAVPDGSDPDTPAPGTPTTAYYRTPEEVAHDMSETFKKWFPAPDEDTKGKIPLALGLVWMRLRRLGNFAIDVFAVPAVKVYRHFLSR